MFAQAVLGIAVHGDAEETVGLQHAPGFFQRALHRGRDVLQHVGGENEVVLPGQLGVRFGEIEAGFAVVEGVGVVELLGQKPVVAILIAHAQAADGLHSGEPGERQAASKQLDGEQMDQPAEAHVGPAGAGGGFAGEVLHFVGGAADVTGEANHRDFQGTSARVFQVMRKPGGRSRRRACTKKLPTPGRSGRKRISSE